MQWLVNDSCYPTKIVETSELIELKEWLQQKGSKCKVNIFPCPERFFLSHEERNKIYGCEGTRGSVGPNGIGYVDPRDPTPNEKVNVSFSFVMSKEKAQLIIEHKLKVTANQYGETIPTWKQSNCTELIGYCRGVYKKPGFDTAYKAISALKPDLTELDFARIKSYSDSHWDKDLVELKLYSGPDSCLEHHTKYEMVETYKSNVELTLRLIDLASNMEYIKATLSACL